MMYMGIVEQQGQKGGLDDQFVTPAIVPVAEGLEILPLDKVA